MIERTPVTVLAGFLGSGKSTLLNSVLRSGELPPTAIVVNEFGETPIDHALVEGVTDGVSLLAGGCVCCAVRTDLEATLRDLNLKRMRGIISPFKALIVEMSGLAEPAPVLQTLCARPMRECGYVLGPVITTVDAVHGCDSIGSHHEAVQQISSADRILITKIDLNPDIAELRTILRRLNPHAPITIATRGAVPASWMLADSRFGDPADDGSGGGSDTQDHDHHHHGPAIAATTIWVEKPLHWEAAQHAIEKFLRRHSKKILRLKGILNIEGLDHPIAIHAIHHSFYPPEHLKRWQDEDHRSRIVVITQDMLTDEVKKELELVAPL